MKGGAKSRKKLSKKGKFQYTAPRLGKDKMTKASLNTHDPSVNIMDRKDSSNKYTKYIEVKKHVVNMI